MPTTSTENLFLAAYALSEGAELRRITVSRANGRKTAVFEIASPEIETLSAAFYNESAVVNLSRFRNKLDGLRDALARALQPTTTTETQDHDRRTHDLHRQGRARSPQGAR